MRNILLIVMAIVPAVFFEQTNIPNVFRLSDSDSHDLYVRFDNGIILENQGNYTSQALQKMIGFEALQREFTIQLNRGIPLSEAQFLEMEQKEIMLGENNEKVSNLRSIFQIQISDPTNQKLYNLGMQLQQLKGVVYCSLISTIPIRPPADIPPTTVNYQPQQSYIGVNPGVNMQYAWDNLQTGTGITIRDVEYGVNVNHEEFAGGGTSIASGMTISSQATTDYTEHGTAVFGIVYSNKGTYGVSGLAHGASAMILYPEWQQSGYSRINAVTQALANSQIGDVIIYEMQEYGFGNNFVPAEYNEVVWDLTVTAGAIGAVIVAAAGNGSQNLDDAFYVPYMDRGDSGAIIVGAGSSDTFHDKLSFSTYGLRVNVQGWGQNVYTTGFFAQNSTSFLIGSDFNQSYSTSFSGTSSATSIVASCVAVLQSYHHSLAGDYLTSMQLKSILQQTGIAQSNIALGNIGPFPDMQAAMQLVANNYLLKAKNNTNPTFSMAPNPATNVLKLAASADFVEGSLIVFYNILGQKVLSVTFNEQSQIDISNLVNGIYFVQITSKNGFSATQKLVKR